MIKTLLLVLITIFLPPVGVFLVAGCGPDLLINILLTLLGFFPGHIHAFYIEYVYIKRRDEVRAGIYNARPAPGVYSAKVQNGGHRSMPVEPQGYVAPAPGHVGGGVPSSTVGGVPVQQGYMQGAGVPAQQGYGTVH